MDFVSSVINKKDFDYISTSPNIEKRDFGTEVKKKSWFLFDDFDKTA